MLKIQFSKLVEKWLFFTQIVVIPSFVVSIVGAVMVIFHHDKFDNEVNLNELKDIYKL